ncbi:MAG: hypothetical protein WC798_01535 [Candidatus Paceibacterota bacterium]|jgi:hypothetical protein
MTWKGASWILAAAALFDALRYFFLFFWFFGPAAAALYCTTKVSGVVGTTVGGLVCGAGAVAGGYLGAPALIAFGTIMAMAVGFAGWLTVTFFIFAANGRAFKDNPFSILWSLGGLGASVLVMVWGIYKTQIENDKKVLKKYEQTQQTMPNAGVY